MADFETVTVRRDGAAATIVLDRPEALNAWNASSERTSSPRSARPRATTTSARSA